jgi:tetratricopeptide (TPR) repeat protein
VGDLVTPLAQHQGVIFADLRQRAIRGDLPSGMSCFITSSDDSRLDSPDAIAPVTRCMNQVVLSDPSFAPGYAKLAEIHLAEYVDKLRPSEEALAQADGAAHKAVELAPDSAGAQAALAEVDYFENKFDDAFRLGRHALELNPLDANFMARLGAAYVARGDLDQGLPLLQHAVALNPAYPGWIDFYLFLAAHLRGDVAGEKQAVSGSYTATFPLGLAARIIVADESAATDDEHRDLADLATRFPEFAHRPRAELERLAFAPAVTDRLVKELAHAGLDTASPSHP